MNIEDVAARIDRRHKVTDSGCWEWTGPIASTGYGCNFAGRSPHRWAWIVRHGDIPAGMVIDHVCHNGAAAAGLCDGGNSCPHRRCVNVDHMRLVTHGDNLAASPLTSNGNGRTRCAFDGCHLIRERATGYCNAHHRRLEKYGDPDVVSERLTRPSTCSVDGCDKQHHANGYCDVHAARVRAHGDPLVVKQLQTNNRPDLCVIDGCGRPHRSRDWCGSHWWRWRNYGDPIAEIPIGDPIPDWMKVRHVLGQDTP